MQNKNVKLFILFIACFLTLSKVVASNAVIDRHSPQAIPIEDFTSDREIANCEQRKLDNKIVLIISKYCMHCKKTVALIKPLVAQYNLNSYLQIFDIINSEDGKTLRGFAIDVSSVPVLIANCHAYVGLKDRNTYDRILSKIKMLDASSR